MTVTAKVIGQSRPPFADWSVPFPPDWNPSGGNITLRDLITRIVNAEVEAFRTRQEERKLVRVLTQSQIRDAVAGGKVDMGGRDLEQEVNSDEAVGAALLAFTDGFYFVFVDGAQQLELDHSVFVKPDSQVTFIRLVPLVGG